MFLKLRENRTVHSEKISPWAAGRVITCFVLLCCYVTQLSRLTKRVTTRLGIFVVKVRENVLISSSALPGPGRASGKNNNTLTDFNYADRKPGNGCNVPGEPPVDNDGNHFNCGNIEPRRRRTRLDHRRAGRERGLQQ